MIRILTDSASDILPAEAEQLGVTVIPLNVTLEDGTVLRDGVDMTPTVYYGVMARCHKLPTTSQPSPELFQRFFLEAAAAGDEVVGIFLSHELSGTCQCARLAADMANVDNVLFVDSENVCLGESLLVRLAVQLRDAGKTAGQIAATLEHAKEHLHLVAVIDDLKYLRKGGRLPAAVAVAGGMLGIKPLITIKEGKVVMAGKARGLPGPVQEDRGAGRHQHLRRRTGRLHPRPPRGAAHPDLPAGESGPERGPCAPDRLCHRHPRRPRRVRPGLPR